MTRTAHSLKQKRIREAVAECKYFLRRVKMYNEEFALHGKMTQEPLINASFALTDALKQMRNDRDATPKLKTHKEPTLLELARSDVKKLYVSKADRAELKDGGIVVRFDRLTSNKHFMSWDEAAQFLANNYPALGINIGDSVCEVVRKLYCGRARPRKCDKREIPF